MRVCLGGTFDNFHKGHKKLIMKATEVAGKNGFLFIGLTTDEFVKNKKNISTFNVRKTGIEEHIRKSNYLAKIEIKEIIDKFGPTLEEDFDAIVVSPESYKTALEINKKRRNLGKKPLKIFKIPYILAEDKKPISSTRIRNKEVDSKGRLVRD